jgi:hypothetical protein
MARGAGERMGDKMNRIDVSRLFGGDDAEWNWFANHALNRTVA